MKKKTWDRMAKVYKKAMKSDETTYEYMYKRLLDVTKDKEVLEVASGPGVLSKKIATVAKKVVATDYSDGMIKEAKKDNPFNNLVFEVADVMSLPYKDKSFDIVIMANVLHLLPNVEGALKEVNRVLKDDGVLVIPNFLVENETKREKLWKKFIKIFGIDFERQWSYDEYLKDLEKYGLKIKFSKLLKARLSLAYVETIKGREDNK